MTIGLLAVADAASAGSGVRRNYYISETSCQVWGLLGRARGFWNTFYCQPTELWDSATHTWDTWYVMYTDR